MLSLPDALTRYLFENLKQPAILQYELALTIFRIYKTKKLKNSAVRVTRDHPLPQDVTRVRTTLLNRGILTASKPLGRYVYLIGEGMKAAPEAIICSVDPFAYISHLSAMSHYGLTDRFPKTIFITSPTPSQWRSLADEKMRKDLGEHFDEYRALQLPILTRAKLPTSGRFMTSRYVTQEFGHHKSVPDSPVRVATLGRVYLDMLRKPSLCGGIRHVIEIFEEHAFSHARLIVNELDQHGSAIEKVRAGYLLETYASVDQSITEHWVQFAQRGGSRRLNPDAEYSNNYSERWCLSLNV
jgi:predicted transcriptional regulator of viral defense system